MQEVSLSRRLKLITEVFGLGRSAMLAGILLVAVVAMLGAYGFFRSAPPTTITVTSGPEGSVFQATAEKYRVILARNGVKLKNLDSKGSLENLERLDNPSSKVDVGFVQGGVTNGVNVEKLVSLGSISYQPLLVFYRAAAPVNLLSEFEGKRLCIGPPGSGTRNLALTLLATNG